MSTLPDLIACAKSELQMRRRTYPTCVTQGRMEEGEAQREIALMREIVTNLEAQLAPPLTFPEARPWRGIDWQVQ